MLFNINEAVSGKAIAVGSMLKKIQLFSYILAIAFAANLLFMFSVVYAETANTAGVSTAPEDGDTSASSTKGNIPIRPVIKQEKLSTAKTITGATVIVEADKVKNSPRLKKRRPFNLRFDIKPYLAIAVLLFIAAKTGYAKTSLSPLRSRISW
ncbi:MAG: hypothetical protein K6T91_09050 [Firmicutes bacterium]|nr:hypothetical protein [Bacillota bacterium]